LTVLGLPILKSLDYADFKRVAELVKNKAHLIEAAKAHVYKHLINGNICHQEWSNIEYNMMRQNKRVDPNNWRSNSYEIPRYPPAHNEPAYKPVASSPFSLSLPSFAHQIFATLDTR